MDKTELIKKAREFTAAHEHYEFYTKVAYSGYPHAIEKLNDLLSEFVLSLEGESLIEGKSKEHLSLKGGLLKSFHCATSQSQWALGKYELAESTEDIKETLCNLIDVVDCEDVYIHWFGDYVSKEKAKYYVRHYDDRTKSFQRVEDLKG